MRFKNLPNLINCLTSLNLQIHFEKREERNLIKIHKHTQLLLNIHHSPTPELKEAELTCNTKKEYKLKNSRLFAKK